MAHVTRMQNTTRCQWAESCEAMRHYHDTEWGRAEYDSQRLFAKLLLDGMQAGLSWRTILLRREGMREVLADFDPVYLASLSDSALLLLLEDSRLIRNRQKIFSLRNNARSYLDLQEQGTDFSTWLWSFCHKIRPRTAAPLPHQVPTQNSVSRAMSLALRAQGFSFCGPVIVYAFMQAVGMVNDHTRDCFLARDSR